MIVVDASVALKWARLEEEFSSNAISLQAKHLDGVEKIIVPKLIFYEFANALTTKTNTTPSQIEKSLEILHESELEIYTESKKTLNESAKLAKKYKTSVYDMLYAVIAKENKTILYTADENFVKKTKLRHVRHISEANLPESD